MNTRTRAELRRIGHPMKPLMRIGAKGLTDAFVTELERSLAAHQLVKVAVDGSGKAELRARAEEVAAKAGAELVDLVGGSALFYREDPEDPLVPSEPGP